MHWTSSTTLEVSGHVTKSGLHDIKSNNEDIYKYGITTCSSHGPLVGYTEDVPWYAPCAESGVYVETDLAAQDGDSGAPIYQKWVDDEGCEWASMIAVLKGGNTEETDNIFGAVAYRITDNNIVFGDNYSGPCSGVT